jgi:predicted ATPase/DNA-binding winged helix-turn-helix (wHTH) protein
VPTWTFGPFRLLPAQQTLLEGDVPVRLGGRAFDILVALVERAGELVGRDELIARVWPNVFVDDSTLRVHIAALRKVLGHGPGGSRYIVSVTGRGYRFAAPVERDSPTTPRPPATPGVAQPQAVFHLPARLNRMVGRNALVLELAGYMPQRRFLTIVGPGGMGKTTVALALAEQLSGSYRDGARFVDLASLANPQLVTNAVASVLDVQLFSGNPLEDLLTHLRDRQMLLLLDSCEHLVDAVAVLAEAVFANAPGVHILATSRERLRTAGEFVYLLPPLGLPMGSTALSAADALNFPALYLFVERAIASLDGFILTDADVPVVVEICRRLDGIPLAIELAAARVDFFGLRGLAQRLGDVFTVLTTGKRTALARHQTLRATLDWSYGILSADEQTILRRLAVFRSGFSLESAIAVAAGAAISAAQAIDGVANLAAKSLVVADVSGAAVQYRLLDLTRAYAAEKLEASGEAPSVARRHAERYCALVATAESDWAVQTRGEWLDTYARLIDDLRSALDWAFSENGDAAIGVALTAKSAPLWFALSLVSEFHGRAEQALALLAGLPQPDAEQEMQLNVAFGAAIFNTHGPTDRMAEAVRRALAIARARGATVYELRALWGLARERYVRGDYRAALGYSEEFSAVADASGDPAASLVRDRMMALGLHLNGDQTKARPYAERALHHPAAVVRSAHKSFHEYDNGVAARSHLARILWVQGFADRAAALAAEGATHARSLDYPPQLCYMLVWSSCPIAFWNGDLALAASYVQLLSEKAAGLSFGYWQAWRQCYERTVALGDNDRTEAFDDRVALILGASKGPVFGDMLGTLREELVGPESIVRAESGSAGWCASELLRAHGEHLLKQGGGGSEATAEQLFFRSISIATAQGALSWELRSAMSLARLWQSQGRGGAARGLLSGVRDRFSEGFGTVDLMRAASLLKTLADNGRPSRGGARLRVAAKLRNP